MALNCKSVRSFWWQPVSESPAALCRLLLSEGEMGPAFGPTFAAGVFSELRPRCQAVEVSIFQKLLRRPPLRRTPCRGPARPGLALALALRRQASSTRQSRTRASAQSPYSRPQAAEGKGGTSRLLFRAGDGVPHAPRPPGCSSQLAM